MRASRIPECAEVRRVEKDRQPVNVQETTGSSRLRSRSRRHTS
ncbi:hypothetical protein HMPREF9621_00428 [Cutibacterium modestum HL037PA2]|nr:hypothetical protein HMPREF9621_00428 [Cutibacterium modestum HL037PA2]